MKLFLRILAVLVGILLILALAGFAFLQFAPPAHP